MTGLRLCAALLAAVMLACGCASTPAARRAADPALKRLRVAVLDPGASGAEARLFEDAVSRLVTHLGEVSVVKDAEEARKGGADLVAAFALEGAWATNIFGAARAALRASFAARDGRIVETIQGSGRQMGRPPLMAADLNLKARELAVLDFEGRVLASQALADHARGRTGASAARPRSPGGAGASEVDKPAYGLTENPDRFAVVVGIETYSGLPAAAYADRDAETLKRHLLALGYPERNIIHLAGASATRGALQGYIEEWLAKNVTPESQVFFYYSGHGAPEPSTGQAYLVPWDGNPQFLQSTAYPLESLYKALGALKARSVIVILDACFSGAGGRSVLAPGARPLVVQGPEERLPEGPLIVLSGASGDEITGVLDDQGHGIFTYYLLKGLNGAARDPSGAVTAAGLYSYLKPKVQDAARRQNRGQTPVLKGHRPDALVLRP